LEPLLIFGSSGKRVPQWYNHHSVVHPIAFARQWRYAKKLAGAQTALAPYSATSSAARRYQTGAHTMHVPGSGTRFLDDPSFFGYLAT